MGKTRYNWIDWIKGIACLAVMWGHSRTLVEQMSPLGDILLNHILRPIFSSGSMMVCLFAILSGYLASLSVGKRSNLFISVIKRYLRFLLPIFFTGVFVYLIQISIGFAPLEMRKAIGCNNNIYSYDIPFSKVLFEGTIGVLFYEKTNINSAFWMMRSLFFGSLVTILLSFLITRCKNKKLPYVLIAVPIAVTVILKDHITMSVVLGFLIGYLKKAEALKKLRGKKLNLFLCIFSFFMANWGHHYAYLLVSKYIMTLPASLDCIAKWLACWMLIFVFSLDNLSVITDRMSHKPIVSMGKQCMGIYCFHNISIFTVGVCSMYFFKIRLGFGADFSFWISLIAVTVVTLLLSYLFSRFVEKYFEKFISMIK